MYRSRIITWVVVMVLGICFLGISDINIEKIHLFREYEEVSFYPDVKDSVIRNQMLDFNGKVKGQYNYKASVGSFISSDVIIKEHSDETIEGYRKYEKMLYTPYIMYIKNASHSSSGCTEVSNAYTKNLASILEALENGKNYADIGMEKMKDGPIVVSIPKDRIDEIKELFYLVLSNEKNSSSKEEEVRNRVDTIIEKCKKHRDILYEIEDDDKNIIYIDLEAYTIHGNCYINSNRAGNYYPVYFEITTANYFDVFVKDNSPKLIHVTDIFKSNTFSEASGVRSIESTDPFQNFSCFMRDVKASN